MWSDERIRSFFGELNGYVAHFSDFAADDDTNGPLFFSRALDDYCASENLTPEQIGKTVLNYVPYEHGFFWWGGYGVSSEHTMYLNLRNGIPAPVSGAVEQNGFIVAEQIGGQIFIDPWGFVCPGDYQKAARYARKAASIAWDGEGIYGGMFVAACISAAFEDNDIYSVLKKGLSVIPSSSQYAKTVKDIMDWHSAHKDDWRACLEYVKKNYWMDKFIGNCHIIPNAAIMILSMLYGDGQFTRSLNICNMCGFDTDCNVGNIGAVLGVLNGLDKMDLDKWFPEINDFQAASSVLGSMNITDVASSAIHFAKLGYKVMGENIPAHLEKVFDDSRRNLNFELPYSTHSMRAEVLENEPVLISVRNTDEDAYQSKRCLSVSAAPMPTGRKLKVYIKTYYSKEDFSNGRYEPVCSPIAYPGQTVSVSVKPKKGMIRVCLYAFDEHEEHYFISSLSTLNEGEWTRLEYMIPPGTDACIKEIGLIVENGGIMKLGGELDFYIDDFSWEGAADYKINLSKEHNWSWLQRDDRTELSQFTRLKGSCLLEKNRLRLFSCDFAEFYTGDVTWRNYSVAQTICPMKGEWSGLNFRVQGAARSYAAVLTKGKVSLYKNVDCTYELLASCFVPVSFGNDYELRVESVDNSIGVYVDGIKCIDYVDSDNPYLNGCIGISSRDGSLAEFGNITVKPL